MSATKGFESSSLQNIHFGTGSDTIIDEIQVIWPDGKSQVFNNVKTDQHLVVSYENAVDFQKQLLPSKQNQQKLYLRISQIRFKFPFDIMKINTMILIRKLLFPKWCQHKGLR